MGYNEKITKRFIKFEKIYRKYDCWGRDESSYSAQVASCCYQLEHEYLIDGDVFDNTYRLTGWIHDLSNYANWLAKYEPKANDILKKVKDCRHNWDYEELIYELCDTLLDMNYLQTHDTDATTESIMNCPGEYHWTNEFVNGTMILNDIGGVIDSRYKNVKKYFDKHGEIPRFNNVGKLIDDDNKELKGVYSL